ncbi:MAG: 30S ribosome-binding factor RbfA [Pseudomonadota bacterium]
MGKRSDLSARAPSQRQLRVGETIRRRLAEIIERTELGDPLLDAIPITVSEVKISPDLRHATVFVMPLGGQQSEAVIEALRNRAGPIRGQLGHGLRLRSVPELKFELDTSFEQAEAMNRLLAGITPSAGDDNPA